MKHTPEVEAIIEAELAREDAHTHDKWYVPACMMDEVVRERDRMQSLVRRLLVNLPDDKELDELRDESLSVLANKKDQT